MRPLRRTVLFNYAMTLFSVGPVCASDIDASWGWSILNRLRDAGLVVRSHEMTSGRGGRPRVYYVLTHDGALLNGLGDEVQPVRRGECCEAAILGIEGDHDPNPLCRRLDAVGPAGAR